MTKSFDREPYLKHSNAAPYEPRVEQTLNEYIKRKQEGPQRITFAEWSKDRYGYDLTELYLVVDSADMLECWNTAIKHGKISP